MAKLVAPPLQEVREVVYSRLEGDASTSGYRLMKEGRSAAMPYLVVGPAYKGTGGTDPELGVHVIVQVDAYAQTERGGSNQVSDMIRAVYAALSSAPLVIDESYRDLAITVEADVLNTNQRDAVTDDFYAQRFARFNFLVST